MERARFILLFLLSLCHANSLAVQTDELGVPQECRPPTTAYSDKLCGSTSDTGSTAMIYGLRYKGAVGTPLSVAESFLREYSRMFGIRGDVRYSHHRDTRSGGRRIFFQEFAGAEPIPGSGVLIGITRDIDGIRSSADAAGNTAPPGFIFITSAERRDYNDSRDDWYVSFATRVNAHGLVADSGVALASLESGRSSAGVALRHALSLTDPGITPLKKVEVFSDIKSACATGDYSFTGTGRVFLSNPNNAAPVAVQLPNLCNQSPVVLDGEWLSVEPESAARTEDPSGLFVYDPTDSRFDEVSVYFHIDNFLSMLFERGFTPDPNQSWKINTEVQSARSVTASADYPTITLTFADPGHPYRNAIHEAAVIAHETMHLVMHRWYSSSFLGVGNKEHWAMGEAYADYFGLVYRSQQLGHFEPWQNPVIGSYYVIEPTDDEPRDLTSADPHFSQYGTATYAGIGTENSLYDNSMIFSTALMDFDRLDGSNHSVSFVLESLVNASEGPSFLKGYDALVQALNGCATVPYPDQEICCDSPICRNAAVEAFSGRGIVLHDAISEPIESPSESLQLIGAYPNPFRNEARIEFQTPSPSDVRVTIYTALGGWVETVLDAHSPGGTTSLTWRPSGLSSGVYLVEIVSGEIVARRKLTYLK